MKVDITLNDLKSLLATARRAETVDSWIEVALQWMEHADKEITRLRGEVSNE